MTGGIRPGGEGLAGVTGDQMGARSNQLDSNGGGVVAQWRLPQGSAGGGADSRESLVACCGSWLAFPCFYRPLHRHSFTSLLRISPRFGVVLAAAWGVNIGRIGNCGGGCNEFVGCSGRKAGTFPSNATANWPLLKPADGVRRAVSVSAGRAFESAGRGAASTASLARKRTPVGATKKGR